LRSLLRSADFLLSSSSTAFLPWDRVSDTESRVRCLFPLACLVQSGFRVNHMNEVDRAWDACYKACNRDASAAPEEFGYSAERHLVALGTLNEPPSFPRVLWLVGRLNRSYWTLPRRSAILVFLVRSLTSNRRVRNSTLVALPANTHMWSQTRMGVPAVR
jgi:hypothetical protein